VLPIKGLPALAYPAGFYAAFMRSINDVQTLSQVVSRCAFGNPSLRIPQLVSGNAAEVSQLAFTRQPGQSILLDSPNLTVPKRVSVTTAEVPHVLQSSVSRNVFGCLICSTRFEA
jgi:hypothetical protein